MKGALCLSGHFRFWEQTFPSVQEMICNSRDVDVFIHAWDRIGFQQRSDDWLRGPFPDETNSPDLDVERLRNAYAPKSIQVENNEMLLSRFKVDCEMYLLEQQALTKHILSQLYSVHRSIALKREYEEKFGFRYDWVMRLRPDYRLLGPALPKAELDLPTQFPCFIVPTAPQSGHGHPVCHRCKQGPHDGPHDEVCDLFAVGSSQGMDHYGALFPT